MTSTAPYIHHLGRMTRLIPSGEDPAALLAAMVEDEAQLSALLALSLLTDDSVRLMHGRPLDLEIDPHLIQTAMPAAHADLRDAAFLHPAAGRFNGPGYGAWYAAETLTTAVCEVRHGFVLRALEDDLPDGASTDYTSYSQAINDVLYDTRQDQAYLSALARDPDDHRAGQALAQRLRPTLIAGVLYRSVHRPGGLCAALLHPHVVRGLRRERRYRLTWDRAERQAHLTVL